MPKRSVSVRVAAVKDPTIEEIVRIPIPESNISAIFSRDLQIKRRKRKTPISGGSDSIGEQNDSNVSTVLEGCPGQSQMSSETCEESVVESQTPGCVTVKPIKIEARATRKSTERQQDCVEVYIGKFTAAETSPVNNAVDMDLAGDHLPVLNSENGAIEEELIENGEAVMINSVLESEFFKVTCSEIHQDKGHKDKQHGGPSSEDYFLFNEQVQKGTERQDQIHEGDDQMGAGSDHPDKPAEELSLDGKTATHSSDGLVFEEVPSEEPTHIDLIGESEGYAKDLDCPDRASTTGSVVAPEGSLGGDLLESEQIEEKLQPFDSSPCSPALQDNSLDLPCEGFSHTDHEYGFKPVGEMCIVHTVFPMGSLEVAAECEVLTVDAEPSPSLLSEVSKSRSTSTASKQGSMRRKIKAPVRLKRPSETVNSENVGQRQAVAKLEGHYRASESPEVENSRSISSTVKRGPVGRKIKAVSFERLSAETVNSENVGQRQAVAKSERHPRASESPEVEKSRNTSAAKRGPVGRKIKAPIRVEGPVETVNSENVNSENVNSENVNSENVGQRQAITKLKRHPGARLEDSNVCPQAEATVNARTPRTSTKRKVILEQALSSEPVVTEESSNSGKNKLTDDQTDRPVPAEKSESVVKRKSTLGPTGRNKPASTDVSGSETKSLSVLIEKWQPATKRKYRSKQARQAKAVTSQKSLSTPVSSNESLPTAVSSNESLSKPVSSVRPMSRIVSLGHCELLEKPLSAVKVKSKSDQAKNLLDPPVVEQPVSANRSRIPLKRVAKSPDGSADVSQTEDIESASTRKSEPALKRKSRISSVTDNIPHKVKPETVSSFDRLVRKPSDSECLSVEVSPSVPDSANANQNIVSSAKQKPTEAIVIPPPGYVSFSHTGDMEISAVILDAIPQLVENGSSQVYLLLKNVTLPSSDRQESLVFAADLNSTPYTFVQTTSLPSKKSAQEMLADKISEPQVAKEIIGPEKSFRIQQAKKQTTQCSSTLDNSSGVEAEDATLPLNADMTSSTRQMVMTAASDQLTNPSLVKWTPGNTSAWLAEHGLDRLLPNFSCMDGSSLIEMAHYFNKDLGTLSKYLQDMGLLFADELKLFAALKTIPTQTCNTIVSSSVEISQAGAAVLSSQVTEVTEVAAPSPRKRGRPPKSVIQLQTCSTTSSSSVEAEQAGTAALSSQVTEVTEMAASSPRKRGRPPKSVIQFQTCSTTSSSSVEAEQAGTAALSSQVTGVTETAAPAPRKRGRPPKSQMMGSGGTNSLPASGGAVKASTLSLPISQWTCQDVSAWLTSQGLARLLSEFVQFDGQSMLELVHVFNTDVRAVHKRLYNMDFTLFESLVFCAGLRTLSQRQDEAGPRFSKQ